jgi:NAD(P)-dependent dehydrogenase (short-subunit alcohol dehydrogenase family)
VHFLLTSLLLDLLEKTEGSRIVSLASIAHKGGNIQRKSYGMSLKR